MSVEGSEGIIEQLYIGYGGRDVPPCNKHSRFAVWVRYFENFEGTLVRCATFVVYWLSCYVLTESPFDHIKAYLFPLAVLLARGESAGVAGEVALRLAPTGAQMTIVPGANSGADSGTGAGADAGTGSGQGVVRVVVSARIGLPGSRLPSLDLSGSAEVACEPGSACPESDQ